MNCKNIQELIITDYIDSQLSKKTRQKVEEHLKTCKNCKKFEKILLKSAIQPFKKVKKHIPPEKIWIEIQKLLVKEKKYIFNISHKFKNFLQIKKLAFTTATVAALFITIFIFINLTLNNTQEINSYLQEQGEFLSKLKSGEKNFYQDEYFLNTSIEKFLFQLNFKN